MAVSSIPNSSDIRESNVLIAAGFAGYIASRAALKALDTSQYTQAYVLGYSVAGDGGGLGAVYFDPASAVADNGGSITAPASGTGRWLMANPSNITPFMFGAKGDRVTDDTVAIQACYDATPAGGTLHLPAAPGLGYRISTQGTNWCLNFSRPVHVKGQGMFSALQPAPGTVSNIIVIKPVPDGGCDGLTFEGIAVMDPSQGTRFGSTAIFIDTTAPASQLPKPKFRDITVTPSSNVGGWAFFHQNSQANNANGGMYGAEIDSCRGLGGGIAFIESGDSNTVKRSIMYGPNIGVYFALVNGAGGAASLLTVEDCNITNSGGAIKGDCGNSFKGVRLNCEQTGQFTNGSRYLVDFAGGTGTMWRADITQSHLAIFSGVSNSGVFHFQNMLGGGVDDCVVLNANANAVGGVIESANDVRIGSINWGSSIGVKVLDTANGTMGVVKPMTLVPSWVSASNQIAQFVKDVGGIVHLSGTVTGGVPNSGITTLPSGFRPSQTLHFSVYSENAGTPVPGSVLIDINGNIVQTSGGTSRLSLDGVSFPAALLSSTTVT